MNGLYLDFCFGPGFFFFAFFISSFSHFETVLLAAFGLQWQRQLAMGECKGLHGYTHDHTKRSTLGRWLEGNL